MTFEDLFSRVPALAIAHRDLMDAENALLAPLGFPPRKLRGELNQSDVLMLITWARLRRLEKVDLQGTPAVKWQPVTGMETGGVEKVIYLSDDGQIASLPRDFVEALQEVTTLSVDIRPLPQDPSMLNLVRGDHAECPFPLSLLRYLIGLRSQGKLLLAKVAPASNVKVSNGE